MVNTVSDKVLHEDERLLMQIRLFRMACSRWGMTLDQCADLFDRHDVDAYIADCYELFHVQGDEANLDEIRGYLRGRGEEL